jgi:glucokinase
MAHTMRATYTGKTQLPDNGTISTTGLVAAAAAGDELAKQIFQEMGYLLGEGLVSMIRILDITTILIGGGISASFEYILPAINERFAYWLTPYYMKTISIKRATLANDAGLLGAASLCFD